MSERSNQSSSKVAAKQSVTFKNAAEAFEYFTGEKLSEKDATEALWYQRLRMRMLAKRKANVKNQAAVAKAMQTSQSEVSRLENNLGPGTRLGTLRSYLAACGTSLEDLLGVVENEPVELVKDPLYAVGDLVKPSLVQKPLRSAKSVVRAVREGMGVSKAPHYERWFGSTSAFVTKAEEEVVEDKEVDIEQSLHALNNMLLRSGVSNHNRAKLILRFLDELMLVRSVGRGQRRKLGQIKDDKIVSTTRTFEESIARPLRLQGF